MRLKRSRKLGTRALNGENNAAQFASLINADLFHCQAVNASKLTVLINRRLEKRATQHAFLM